MTTKSLQLWILSLNYTQRFKEWFLLLFHQNSTTQFIESSFAKLAYTHDDLATRLPLPEGERATPPRGKGQPKVDKEVLLQKVVLRIEGKKK